MSGNDQMDPSSGNSSRPFLKRKCKNYDSSSSPEIANKKVKLSTAKATKEEKPYHSDFLFTDLPNEIIVRILENVSFGDLFKLESVSERFREVVLNFVWPKKDTLSHEARTLFSDLPNINPNEVQIGMVITRRIITIKSIKAVFSRTNIQHLDLIDYHEYINNQICPLLSLTPQLLSLNLSTIMLEKNDLMNVAKYCPFLEKISLRRSFFDAESEIGLEHIFIKCPNIKYLDLSGNIKINGASFVHIPTQLKYLNIASCYKFSFQAMNHLANRAKNLEMLILSRNNSIPNIMNWLNDFTKLRFFELTDLKGFFLDFSNLKELEMLCLKFYHSFDQATLRSLQDCTKLKSLEIHLFCHPTIINFETLKQCKALKHFSIFGYKKINHIINFAQSLKIKYLSISRCGSINSANIKKLLTECDFLTHLEFPFNNRINYKAIERFLKQECPERRKNILKLVIQEPPLQLPPSKWCEVIEIESLGSRVFSHFTDVRVQYQKQKLLR